MEIQIQELLEKIKQDGIDPAKEESSRIVAEANERAKSIVADAEKEASAIIAKAKTDAKGFEESAKAAVAHSARDLIIGFRASIEKSLSAIVTSETAAAFSGSALETAVVTVVKTMISQSESDFDALLPPSEFKKIEGSLRSKLADELKKGVELKPFAGVRSGFRIAEKNGSAYYDFSADAVADMLSARVNAEVAEILRNAVKEA